MATFLLTQCKLSSMYPLSKEMWKTLSLKIINVILVRIISNVGFVSLLT